MAVRRASRSSCAQAQIAGNIGPFAALRNGTFDTGIAVAVDDQARIVLRYQSGIERGGHLLRDSQAADVPGNVPLQFRFRQTQVAEAPRNAATGMIDHDQELRATCRIHFQERRWLIGRKQAVAAGQRRVGAQ